MNEEYQVGDTVTIPRSFLRNMLPDLDQEVDSELGEAKLYKNDPNALARLTQSEGIDGKLVEKNGDDWKVDVTYYNPSGEKEEKRLTLSTKAFSKKRGNQ